MGKRVFISYSHQDSVCAKGIARFLTRQGYDVWIDVDKLVVGQSWANNINEALQTADMMIALISKNSVRRMEVLREISEALDRNEKDENFYVLFVVIGNVHPSWFPDTGDGKVKKIIECLQVIQFIQLDAKGTISIAKMQELIRALNGKMTYTEGIDFRKSNEYIYEAGVPEKVYDNVAENCFYRVHASDLAPSTAFPFALDNQWLPDEIIADDSDMKGQNFSAMRRYLIRSGRSVIISILRTGHWTGSFHIGKECTGESISNWSSILQTVLRTGKWISVILRI